MGLPHRIIIAATASYLIHETHQTLATCNAECKLTRKEGFCPVCACEVPAAEPLALSLIHI